MTRKKWNRQAVWILTAAVTGTLASGCGRGYDAVDLRTVVAADAELSGSEENVQNILPSVSEKETEFAMAPAPAFTDVADTVYIKGNQVRLRTSPTTADPSNIYTVLNNGAALSRTGDSDDWCRVSYQGQVLYVFKTYISSGQPGGTGTSGGGAADSQTAGSQGTAGSQETAESQGTAGVQETGSQGTSAAVPGAASEAGAASGTGTANGTKAEIADGSMITVDENWLYANYSAIKTGAAVMYRSGSANRKEITVCVNAGHGTSGGESVKTFCHPDGTPKVTGGSTASGAIKAAAVSSGMTFADGTPERDVTLALAKVLKDKLLADGYDVVMIRESDDVQLDNIARTVIANNTADCHIALHWDSTTSDKGAFYMSVPNVASYRAMEPVASNWQKHNNLGENLIAGLRTAGVKIFSGGSMAMDLTQTSYSTVPSVDIELGDKVSDHSAAAMEVLANGLLAGINSYFGK